MAKVKYQKRSGAGKVAAAIAVILLIAIIALGAVWGTGFAITGKANPAEWGTVQTPGDETDKPNGTPTDGMTVNTVSSERVKLRAMPMTASADRATDSSYYLTATVEPADAWEQELEWSVAFKNPAADWAKGKSVSSYVSVTPSSDTHNATVTCLGGFGEQVVVTAKSKDNPAALATCTCDYVKRATNVKVIFSEVNTTGMTYTCEYEYSAYTVDSEIQLSGAKITGEYSFVNYIRDSLDGNQIFGSNEYASLEQAGFAIVNAVSPAGQRSLKVDGNTVTLEKGFYDVVNLSGNYTDSDGEGNYDLTAAQMSKLRTAYIQAVKNGISSYTGTHATLWLGFNIVRDGERFGTQGVNININFTYDSVKVPVTNVILDKSHIDF